MHYCLVRTSCIQLMMVLCSNITSCAPLTAHKTLPICEEHMLWRVKWMTVPLQITSLHLGKKKKKKSFMTDSLNFHPGRLYPQADMLHDCQLWILCMRVGSYGSHPPNSTCLSPASNRLNPIITLQKIQPERERTQSSQFSPPLPVRLAVKDALGFKGNDASDFCK